jgi:hypothetical protein
MFRSALSDFSGRANYLFVMQPSGESLNFSIEPPALANIKKKFLLVIKARPETKEPGFPTGIANEVVFMEMNKPILESLHNTCQVSYSLSAIRMTRSFTNFKFLNRFR